MNSLKNVRQTAARCFVFSFVLCYISCDRVGKGSSPSHGDSNVEQTQREEAALQAQREEKSAKVKREEEAAQVQRENAALNARRAEESLRAQQEDATRQSQKKEESLREMREEVRRQAKGQTIDRLVTTQGKTYEQVTIKEVSPVGVSILHNAGSARIPFEVLPADLRKRFMFNSDEKNETLKKEQANQISHEQASVTTETPGAPIAKSNSGPDRKKVMMALASKQARVGTLQHEIYDKQNEIQNDENKMIRRDGYYSNGRYYTNRVGGVSRAPILREELAKKERELNVLNQQIAALQVELDSAAP